MLTSEQELDVLKRLDRLEGQVKRITHILMTRTGENLKQDRLALVAIEEITGGNNAQR